MDDQKMKTISKQDEAEFKRSVSKQVTLGLLTNFCSIAPSMSLGFSAVVIHTLQKTLNPEQVSWFASIASLAAPFGCFLSGPIADRFGRKAALFWINIISFIGWFIISVAYYTSESQYVLLLLGRLVTGFSAGISSAPATIYMAEVSSPKLRGVFTTWATIYFSLGVMVVYMLGFIFKESWGTIALITATLPCVGVLLIVCLVPESPAWLVGKNRLEEAKINIHKIFDTKTYSSQVQTELESLIKQKGIKTIVKKRSIPQQFIRKVKYLLKPLCLKPFCLILSFFFFQQFSGTFVVVFYAIDIVKSAGITVDPYLTIVMIGLVRTVTAMILSYISKKYGRRPLSIFSGTGMAICMLALAGYISLINQGSIHPDIQSKLTFLPLALLLLYFLTSTLGFLPLPFAMAAELFPTKIRGTASGLLAGSGHMFSFVTVKVYPNMVDGMGKAGVFFFYGIIALLGTIFVIYFLPETKGKSLQEIQEYFGEKKKQTKAEEGEEENFKV